MNIKFEDIKPLVEDASIVGNRMICKFRDKKSGQVILSAADFTPGASRSGAINAASKSIWNKLAEGVGLDGLLTNKRTVLKTEQQQAIIKAFHKVYNQFELQNGKLQLKPNYHVQDIWKNG
jgi:hypothetical protein